MKKLFTFIMCLFYFSSQAQIDECTGFEELYRGRHKINGMTYSHPYTTFDRHNEISFDLTLTRIRSKIRNGNEGDPVYDAYVKAYANAVSPIPNSDDDNGLRKLIDGDFYDSEIPFWGKNNAFVFLIGIDSSGNGYLDSLNDGNIIRNGFRDRAIEAFEHLSGGIDHMNVFTMVFHMGDMQHYAIALK